jgi:hypothetical protein
MGSVFPLGEIRGPGIEVLETEQSLNPPVVVDVFA